MPHKMKGSGQDDSRLMGGLGLAGHKSSPGCLGWILILSSSQSGVMLGTNQICVNDYVGADLGRTWY